MYVNRSSVKEFNDKNPPIKKLKVKFNTSDIGSYLYNIGCSVSISVNLFPERYRNANRSLNHQERHAFLIYL